MPTCHQWLSSPWGFFETIPVLNHRFPWISKAHNVCWSPRVIHTGSKACISLEMQIRRKLKNCFKFRFMIFSGSCQQQFKLLKLKNTFDFKFSQLLLCKLIKFEISQVKTIQQHNTTPSMIIKDLKLRSATVRQKLSCSVVKK